MDSINRGAIRGSSAGLDEESSKRTRTRDSLFLMAQLRIDDDPRIREVRVRNLSEGGLMVEFDKGIAANTRVWLELRGIGEISGRVAWCTEGRIGVALDAPIDPKKARKPVGGGTTTPVFTKPVMFKAPLRR